MEPDRIHRTRSADGTEIAGGVYGHGPALVLVHGAVADGESEWSELLPWLTDRFTCYLPSTRGRGLSGTHPDLSREAQVRDVTAFVDSIGEPAGLVGVSGGGMLALGAAARASAVTALAAIEPVVFEVQGPEDRGRLRHIADLAAEAIREGRPAEGSATFLEWIANEEEVAALSGDPEGLESLAAYLPIDVEQFREALDFTGPSPTAPSVCERITAPVLLLHGSGTALGWFTDSVRYAAEHIPHATVREVPGAGHLAHLVRPERHAAELIAFLDHHVAGRAERQAVGH